MGGELLTYQRKYWKDYRKEYFLCALLIVSERWTRWVFKRVPCI